LRAAVNSLKSPGAGQYAQACEFLRTFAGARSSFFETAGRLEKSVPIDRAHSTADVLESFAEYVENGLLQEMGLERQAQLHVVSDLLEQAKSLIDDEKVHPGAAAVLVGATLEEFLRTWVKEKSLSLGSRKPSIDAYANCLRSENLITKQDTKEITSWAGIRNHAAHGEWDQVADRKKVSLVMEGVNLFMQKYGMGKLSPS
jgi:hypothetical protein